jgi:hypothetical protein
MGGIHILKKILGKKIGVLPKYVLSLAGGWVCLY